MAARSLRRAPTLYYLSCFPRTCYKRYPRTFTILKLPIPRYPSLPARCFYSLDRAFLNDLRIRRISRRILRSFSRFALSRKFYDYDKMKKRIGDMRIAIDLWCIWHIKRRRFISISYGCWTWVSNWNSKLSRWESEI